MTWLIRALLKRKHKIQQFTYFDKFDHFLPDVRAMGIEPENISASSRIGRFWNVRKAIRRNKPDCIISFLNTPNLIGVFSSLRPGRIPLIVSERSLDIHGKTMSNRIRFNAFRMADRVVTNSQSQSKFIADNYPFLKTKTVVIPNCVDLDKFHPQQKQQSRPGKRLIVAASVIPVKNTHRLIKAVKLANQDAEVPILVDWFGNNLFVDGKPTPASKYFIEARDLVTQLGLESEFKFHDTVSDIHSRFASYDAVCLPSLFEGCPNIVCEAMSSGMPVLASNISDLQTLFGNFELLFEPTSIESIASTLKQFAQMSNTSLDQIGKQNRIEAKKRFSPERFAASYDKLVHLVTGQDYEGSSPIHV